MEWKKFKTLKERCLVPVSGVETISVCLRSDNQELSLPGVFKVNNF